MTKSIYQDPSVSKWLKEQNAVATKWGYINSQTGEQLTSDRGLDIELELDKPNIPSLLKNHQVGTGDDDGHEEDTEETATTYTFTETATNVSAELNEDNNNTGHEFTIGVLKNSDETSLTDSVSVELEDNTGSTWKISLKTASTNGNVVGVLKRYRKDQVDDVNETVTLKVKVGEQVFDVPLTINITLPE